MIHDYIQYITIIDNNYTKQLYKTIKMNINDIITIADGVKLALKCVADCSTFAEYCTIVHVKALITKSWDVTRKPYTDAIQHSSNIINVVLDNVTELYHIARSVLAFTVSVSNDIDKTSQECSLRELLSSTLQSLALVLNLFKRNVNMQLGHTNTCKGR